MTTLSDYLNSINLSKQELPLDDYIPMAISRCLMRTFDSHLQVSILNYPNIDNSLHYHYLLSSLSKRKRFAQKFGKSVSDEEMKEIESISKKYNVNYEIAKKYKKIESEKL